MIVELSIAVALAVAVAGDIYDVTMTEKGLQAKVAVEGNTFLVGDKPSARALFLRDGVILALCMVPTLLSFYKLHNAPIGYGSLVVPGYYGVDHMLGGLAWRKLLKK